MSKLFFVVALTVGSIYGGFNAIDSISTVASDRAATIEHYSE